MSADDSSTKGDVVESSMSTATCADSDAILVVSFGKEGLRLVSSVEPDRTYLSTAECQSTFEGLLELSMESSAEDDMTEELISCTSVGGILVSDWVERAMVGLNTILVSTGELASY